MKRRGDDYYDFCYNIAVMRYVEVVSHNTNHEGTILELEQVLIAVLFFL